MKSSDLSDSPLLPNLSWRRISRRRRPRYRRDARRYRCWQHHHCCPKWRPVGLPLLLLQFVLIPILYIVQELTVRLGIITRKGHAELIRDHYGRGWAWVSVATLVVACIGALFSELSGLAGVGLLMGVPAPSRCR